MARLRNKNYDFAMGMLIAVKYTGFVTQYYFTVHIHTISRLQNRFARGTIMADRPRSGRPRVTTPRQDRFLQRLTFTRTFFKKPICPKAMLFMKLLVLNVQ